MVNDPLDRFYTPQKAVERCFGAVSLEPYDLVVEPSAGAGAFSSRIPNCVAFDIEPAANEVTKADWFNVTEWELPPHQTMLVIGNPPFGRRSTLAKGFITHAIAIGASTVAFVLPKTFVKFENQRMFPNNWRLVAQVDLGKPDFILPDGNAIGIPCDFFVWTKLPEVEEGVNLRATKVAPSNDFFFLGRGDPSADFVVNGNSGRVRQLDEVTNPKAEHYIKVTDPNRVQQVRETFEACEFGFVSSVSGGVAWINQNDIHTAYHKAQQVTKGQVDKVS